MQQDCSRALLLTILFLRLLILHAPSLGDLLFRWLFRWHVYDIGFRESKSLSTQARVSEMLLTRSYLLA